MVKGEGEIFFDPVLGSILGVFAFVSFFEYALIYFTEEFCHCEGIYSRLRIATVVEPSNPFFILGCRTGSSSYHASAFYFYCVPFVALS